MIAPPQFSSCARIYQKIAIVDSTPQRQVLVCQHRTCLKDGAQRVLATFQQESIPNVTIKASGCLGLCGSGPMVVVLPDNVYYWHINPQKAQAIITTHLLGNIQIQALFHPRLHPNR
ncbi:MAG: (2Fe-2S) ferredoxin domain-containing protein [Pseudanabaena sp.]